MGGPPAQVSTGGSAVAERPAADAAGGHRRRLAMTHERTVIALLVAAVVAATLVVVVPLVEGEPLIGYTADDALISFRYSENLANGHGPVWNTSGPRADGYTSALWMVLVAIPDAVGADPEVAAKVLSLLAGLAIVALLALAGPRRAALVRAVAIGALVLSPAFLTLTVQGMETTVAALLATLVAWLLVAAVRSPGRRRLAAFNVACLLAVLARPDLLPFVAVCLAGLAVWLIRARDRRALLRAAAWTAGALVLPGLVWALWRWSYYGYPLPNTAYAKRSDQLIDPQARHMVRTFVTTFAWPYLAVLAVLAVRALRRPRPDTALLWAIGSALLGSAASLFAGLFFSPIQGDLWRFQMPVFPVLLLCAVLLAAHDEGVAGLGMRGRLGGRGLAWGAAAAIAAFALTTVGETRFEVRGRWVYDREQAGKALAPFAGDGMTMFVTESGAIPFYSGWRAYDLLGLNDHFVAERGAHPGYVGALHPDLLQFIIEPGARPGAPYDAFRALLSSGRYEFALATVKTDDDLTPGVPSQAHFYFVRRDAPRAADVLSTLRDLRGVRRVAPALAAQTARDMGYPG